MAVCADESRHHHAARNIASFGARGDFDFVYRADGENLPLGDHERSTFDGFSFDGNNFRVLKGNDLVVRACFADEKH
ncbi:MAG: hypothetical protein AAGJ83_02870 [Planctomycetota bacterium]